MNADTENFTRLSGREDSSQSAEMKTLAKKPARKVALRKPATKKKPTLAAEPIEYLRAGAIKLKPRHYALECADVGPSARRIRGDIHGGVEKT